MTTNHSIINFNKLEENIDKLSSEYINALPFEVVIIDDFLSEYGLKSIDTEKLNKTPSTKEQSSDFIFAKSKFENPRFEEISDSLKLLREELLSERFQDILKKITSKNIFVDPQFVGGGLHQGGKGSFLDMHADFTRHPANKDWVREHNLLLYLNRDWKHEYGGCLDLENSINGNKKSIEPIENRMIIMLTKQHTLHGYRKISFPENYLRTSIAAYTYSIDDGSQFIPYKSTTWQPKTKAKYLFSRVQNFLVPIKQKFFGSRTSKRAQRKDHN